MRKTSIGNALQQVSNGFKILFNGISFSQTLGDVSMIGGGSYDFNYPQINSNAVGLIYKESSDITVGNTTTETTILSSTITLPANYATSVIGVRGILFGDISTYTSGTLNFKLKLGSTIIAQTAAFTPTASMSGKPLSLMFDLTFRTTGVSGTAIGQVIADYQSTLSGASTRSSTPQTSASTVDTTGALVLDLTATWSVANSANTLSIRNASIWTE